MEKYFNFFRNYNYKHLISLRPGPFTPKIEKILLIFFGTLLFLAILIKIFSLFKFKKNKLFKKFIDKIFNFFATLGVLGYLFFFFSQEGIPLLGARFWFLIWGLIFIVWLINLIFFFVKKIPEEREKIQQQEKLKKYLPKKKK